MDKDEYFLDELDCDAEDEGTVYHREQIIRKLEEDKDFSPTGYFPIKVRYENGQVATIQHPDHIDSGVSFKVLDTNVEG